LRIHLRRLRALAITYGSRSDGLGGGSLRIFGRNRFRGYVKQRKELDAIAREEMGQIREMEKEQVTPPEGLEVLKSIAKLGDQPGFMDCNSIDLLIDGEATFASMMEAIRSAKSYVLFQFYVIRPDKIGTEFSDLLIQKAKEGVRVYFLYDAMGTSLHAKFIRTLKAAGIHVSRFNSTRFMSARIQINFRNHRKNLVVDGQVAFIGGMNVGDDYLGRYPKIGPWRDTHCRIAGPAALTAQLSFLKDWHWSEEEILDLDWTTQKQSEGSHVMIHHTGPADRGEAALLAHIALINKAKERVWISNPYIVPPEALSSALSLAVSRGVDVRILAPSYSDNKLVMWASEVYTESLLHMGVRFFQYLPGFLHQKVMLIDDKIATVGSTNLDPRSFFINFEIMAISPHPEFVENVASMLKRDFSKSREIFANDLRSRSLPRQILSRAAALISPVL
jgi:cardiolipin synthase A/B